MLKEQVLRVRRLNLLGFMKIKKLTNSAIASSMGQVLNENWTANRSVHRNIQGGGHTARGQDCFQRV